MNKRFSFDSANAVMHTFRRQTAGKREMKSRICTPMTVAQSRKRLGAW